MAGESAEADLYPILIRRASRDAVVTLGGALLLAAAVTTAAGLSILAVIKAAAIPIVLIVLVAPHLREHPLEHLGPANHLTLLRAVVVSPLAGFIGEASAETYSLGLVAVAVLAFVMDWVDGRVARATNTASPFGARLDMELDGLTVLLLTGLALWLDRAGVWVLAAGLARYAFIGAGWIWPWMEAELPPAPRRAIACGLGVTALVAALAPWSLPWAGLPWMGPLLSTAAVVILVGSFAIDVVWLWRIRHQAPRPDRARRSAPG
ncbi:MAG TPA: CDP-alcohol phosphatidyltransferase family protein [Deltaproteobacteria bacterium]|nr:CDP-alcohol phosphatidyltransferase family protein [Deltaproteobacteria bacterium]